MRFDDGLDTVLAAPMAGPAGLQAMWRQTVDLIGRRRSRGEAVQAAIVRLRAIRHDVPANVRAASARGLARANPPAALVALFADDETDVAAPVIRVARLSAAEWIALLPDMRPATRGVLRHRRDLSETVERALAAFGPSDFALPSAAPAGIWPPVAAEDWPAMNWPPEPATKEPSAEAEPVPTTVVPAWPPEPVAEVEPVPIVPEPTGVWPPVLAEPPVAAPELPAVEPTGLWPPAREELATESDPVADAPPGIWPPEPFKAVGDISPTPLTEQLPEPVAEAEAPDVVPTVEPPVLDTPVVAADAEAEPASVLTPPAFVAPEPTPFVALADVARELPVVAEALRLEREPAPQASDFEIAEIVARIEAHQRVTEQMRPPDATPVDDAPDRFRFETDANGLVRWCDHPVRGPLIGLSLAAGRDGMPTSADGSAGGALARRAAFADARLTVPGASPAAGAWRISAVPAFDHATGRFTGFRGTARRPRPDEEPRLARPSPATDALRQLVHELRTPANAISGFAEMIEHELLGPVPAAYREQATAIRTQTGGLLSAIDDLDTAARIESRSLEQRREAVPLARIVDRVRADLRDLADLRGASLAVEVAPDAVAQGDAAVLQRLFARLFTALVAHTGPGEAVTGSFVLEGDTIRGDLARPASLSVTETALFSADAETEAAADGEPLLGSGFAFRLARRLIAESGGSLTIAADNLTVRLPAAVNGRVEQATV